MAKRWSPFAKLDDNSLAQMEKFFLSYYCEKHTHTHTVRPVLEHVESRGRLADWQTGSGGGSPLSRA